VRLVDRRLAETFLGPFDFVFSFVADTAIAVVVKEELLCTETSAP